MAESNLGAMLSDRDFEQNRVWFRQLHNMEREWLLQYIQRVHGGGAASCLEDDWEEGLDYLSSNLKAEEWQDLWCHWREYEEKHYGSAQQWDSALRLFRALCKEHELNPADALHILTLEMHADNVQTVKRDLAALERVRDKLK